MRLNQLITEGVVVHGYSLLAYTITIAEFYADLPELDESALPAWEALIASDEHLFQRVFGDIDVEFTPEDPYKNVRDVIADVLLHHHLAVFKTPGSTHPGMTPAQNDTFRALHDALSHVGGNSQDFNRFVKQALIQSKDDARLKEYKVVSSGFNVRGEMNAYVTHARMAPRAAVPALFTEIVGQICTYFVTGDYTNNKVAIMDNVDFQNVGILYGSAERRMEELLDLITDDTVQEIQTNVNGIVLDKSKIRWKLLSPGTGAGKLS